jgi:cytochrome b involved in lipid metabolism
MSSTSEKIITAEELGKHNTRNDLWIVVNGKVYDVSKFIDEHPGGEEVLLDIGGKDATREFEDVGHSEDAVGILDRLYVGPADPEVRFYCLFILSGCKFG